MTTGVDVSKDFLAVFNFANLAQTIANSKSAVVKFLSSLPEGSTIAMEATGKYHRLLADMAFAKGFRVYVFNPKDAQRFANSINPRAKTDKADAKAIALFAEAREHQPYKPTPPLAESIKNLVRARSRLVTQRTANRNQLVGNPDALDCLSQAIDGLKQSIDQLGKQITSLVQDLPEYALLDAIPGFGSLTTAYILAMLLSGTFRRSDSFVAFLGLDVRIKDSGKKVGLRCLTKRGDPEARRLLYLAAAAAIRMPGPYQDLYNRYLANGLHKTQALVAVARKLARTAWAIYNTKQHYNPERVLRQPSTQQPAQDQTQSSQPMPIIPHEQKRNIPPPSTEKPAKDKQNLDNST